MQITGGEGRTAGRWAGPNEPGRAYGRPRKPSAVGLQKGDRSCRECRERRDGFVWVQDEIWD